MQCDSSFSKLYAAAIFANKRGSAAIEFALVLPVFLLLVMGIIEFSLVMATSSVLEGAVLAAAREGSTGYVPTGQTQQTYITSLIKNHVKGFLNPSKLTITLPANINTPGALVQYTASYPLPIVDPIMSKIIGTQVTRPRMGALVSGNQGGSVYTVSATAVVQNEMHP